MTNWNSWKITDDQAEQIRNGDKFARDKFYFDNLDRIRAMAFNYAKHNPRCIGLFEDMVQGVYLDLLYFNQQNGKPVTDGKTLSGFIYSSFRFTPYGGLLYCSKNNPKILAGGGLKTYAPDLLSLDKVFGRCNNAQRHQDDDSVRTLADVIPAPDTLDKVDYTDDLKKVCAPYLSPRNREYFDFFIEGYGYAEISRKFGREVNLDRLRKQLRTHVNEILAGLDSLGVPVEHLKGVAPFNSKTDRIYKLSVERRARGAESMRRQRARKKLFSHDSPPAA